MYISLKDSCSKGFNKWSDAHQPEIKKDVLADGGDEVVAAGAGLDNRRCVAQAASSATARTRPGYALKIRHRIHFPRGYERPAAYSASRSSLNP